MSTIQPSPPPGCPFHNKPLPQALVDSSQDPSTVIKDSLDPAGLADKVHDARGALIPCPWWRVVVNSNLVKVDSEGNVSMKDLRHALKESGVTFGLREAAILGIKKVAAQLAGKATGGISGFINTMMMDKINVLDLPKSSLMHTGDSGTLRGGFHQENLDRLLSYSTDGENVTQSDLAKANQKQVDADPGESGHKFGVAEYSILLNVFGRKNEAGEKYLSKKEATQIFKDNVFPEAWKKPKVGFISLGKSVLGMFKSQKNEAAEKPAAPTAAGPEKTGDIKSCPFLNGKPFTAEEAAQQHAEVMQG